MHANNEKPFSPSGIDDTEGFMDKLSHDELELWPDSGGPPTPLLARHPPHVRAYSLAGPCAASWLC